MQGAAKLIINQIPVSQLKEYENNPRHNEAAVDKVAASIKEFGFKVPIVIDENNIIIAGHTRLKAAKQLGIEKVPCIVASDLSPEQIKAFRITDNKTSEFAEWNMEMLEQELSELQQMDFDMGKFGFDDFESEQLEKTYDDFEKGKLTSRFLIPPFSVLDTRQGYWQERKKYWQQILSSGEGRDEGLLGDGLKRLAQIQKSSLSGTSIFDPVLCEVLVNWFCPINGNVIDCFAGSNVRGVVTEYTDRRYVGCDLSKGQIEANENSLLRINQIQGFENINPVWINGDSAEINMLANGEYDFMLTCPPYADLEVYSDNEKDISNMNYDNFAAAYTKIIKNTVSMLKENAFAAIVVGSVRDKKGNIRSFIRDTIKAFEAAGMVLYNEMILIECIGTAAIRAGKQFSAKRKTVKTHQNILIFLKGEPQKIELSDIDYDINELADIVGVELEDD